MLQHTALLQQPSGTRAAAPPCDWLQLSSDSNSNTSSGLRCRPKDGKQAALGGSFGPSTPACVVHTPPRQGPRAHRLSGTQPTGAAGGASSWDALLVAAGVARLKRLRSQPRAQRSLRPRVAASSRGSATGNCDGYQPQTMVAAAAAGSPAPGTPRATAAAAGTAMLAAALAPPGSQCAKWHGAQAAELEGDLRLQRATLEALKQRLSELGPQGAQGAPPAAAAPLRLCAPSPAPGSSATPSSPRAAAKSGPARLLALEARIQAAILSLSAPDSELAQLAQARSFLSQF